MDNNINYTITDTNNSEQFDIKLYNIDLYNDTLLNNNNSHNDELVSIFMYDELYILYMSYTVKSLTQILDYYDINKYNITNKKKLIKEEIIKILIIFELDIINKDIVFKRRRLWNNITELTNDHFFKNYITFIA